MDNLTHSLVGAVLGQTGLKKKTGLAMPALIIGANLPDVDAACFFWLEGTEHLGFRRGITHGPPALVLLPLVLAGLLWAFDRWQTKRGKRPDGRVPVHFGWLFALSFIGCLTHPALDWLNVYGIRFLEPFSSQWFYGDTLFIIDVWLWAMLIVSVWWSLRAEKRSKSWRWPAFGGLAAALLYIGGNLFWSIGSAASFSISNKGIAFPAETLIASPVPFWPQDREIIAGRKNDYYIVPAGVEPVRENAMPVTDQRCAWPELEPLRAVNSQLDAFLFWSRTPFATRADDGSVVLSDARFYDPRARDRFSIALPDVKCEEPDPQ
ncbi:metal-dependent hydrolase [Erythrobacter sp. MTPC3]|uniref:metal-dependent hydrolase n=1 Tax=Erythrobacter sp. MTPC3 TaxID=3056564 RepID=UPI0036F30615